MPFIPSSILSRLLLTAGLLCAASGCTTYIIPPPHPSDPVPVYVADYGRHSSLILPDGRGGLVEYAYGDWDWFALNHTGFLDGVHALFFSSRATLGRRELHDSSSSVAIGKELGVLQIATFDASTSRVENLMTKLNARFDRHADTRLYSEADKMWHVRDDEHYGIFNNCNHLTARWIRELDCRLEGVVFWAHLRVKEGAR